MIAAPSTIDRPFAPPPDIVLVLPEAPSINRTKRPNWKTKGAIADWVRTMDYEVVQQRSWPATLRKLDRFELHLTISEEGSDPDNGLKHIIDYLRTRGGLLANDARRNMRRLVVEIGDVPAGMVRVTVRPIGVVG